MIDWFRYRAAKNRLHAIVADIEREFAGLAREWKLRVVLRESTWVLVRVIYANDERLLSLSLDIRDGYLTGRYGPVSVLREDGMGLLWPEMETLGSTDLLLHNAGSPQLVSGSGLYEEGLLAAEIRRLAEVVRRFEGTIFGPAWDHAGE